MTSNSNPLAATPVLYAFLLGLTLITPFLGMAAAAIIAMRFPKRLNQFALYVIGLSIYYTAKTTIGLGAVDVHLPFSQVFRLGVGFLVMFSGYFLSFLLVLHGWKRVDNAKETSAKAQGAAIVAVGVTFMILTIFVLSLRDTVPMPEAYRDRTGEVSEVML